MCLMTPFTNPNGPARWAGSQMPIIIALFALAIFGFTQLPSIFQKIVLIVGGCAFLYWLLCLLYFSVKGKFIALSSRSNTTKGTTDSAQSVSSPVVADKRSLADDAVVLSMQEDHFL